MKQYEIVIGLETHVELATESKIFCGCSTQFGAEPNTQCCPVCTGMPGVLPVLNERVVELAVRAGLALGCSINLENRFDRKNYFYPDLPKAYQISQLYAPICVNGQVQIGEKTIGIHEIHMEEDAAGLYHDPFLEQTRVDYNRCGVPLIEIVTEPDFRSAAEVVAYLERLKERLVYLGVSDCKMQEGSLRVDVNLSVRAMGAAEYGTRTEMKNLNSFKAIARAIEVEARRQIERLEAGERVIQETRRWDENKDMSYSMRSKEDAQDYRYFPEPDLSVIHLNKAYVDALAASQAELAEEKRARYVAQWGLTEYDAVTITAERAVCQFFEEAVALGAPPKECANWVMGQVLRRRKEEGAVEVALAPQALVRILQLLDAGKINRGAAVVVFDAVYLGGDVDEVIAQQGLEQVNDDAFVRGCIAEMLQEQAAALAQYRAGEEKVFGFLIGQVMKKTKGKAAPEHVTRLLKETISALQ